MLNIGSLRLVLGQRDRARELLEGALAIGREIGARTQESDALCRLAQLAAEEDDFTEATRLVEGALPLVRETGGATAATEALLLLGELQWLTGKEQEARATLAEVVALSRQQQPPCLVLALTLAACLPGGDVEAARGAYEDGRRRAHATGAVPALPRDGRADVPGHRPAAPRSPGRARSGRLRASRCSRISVCTGRSRRPGASARLETLARWSDPKRGGLEYDMDPRKSARGTRHATWFLAIGVLLLLAASGARSSDDAAIAVRFEPGPKGSPLAPRYSPKGWRVRSPRPSERFRKASNRWRVDSRWDPRRARRRTPAGGGAERGGEALRPPLGRHGCATAPSRTRRRKRPTPSHARHTVYTSYDAVVRVNHGTPDEPVWEAYPIGLWVAVESEDADPALHPLQPARLPRRLPSRSTSAPYRVVLSDANNDAVYGEGDWWSILPAEGGVVERHRPQPQGRRLRVGRSRGVSPRAGGHAGARGAPDRLRSRA